MVSEPFQVPVPSVPRGVETDSYLPRQHLEVTGDSLGSPGGTAARGFRVGLLQAAFGNGAVARLIAFWGTEIFRWCHQIYSLSIFILKEWKFH